MITDLTKGTPSKLLWEFSIPLLLSVMFQQLYNVVDSIVAGRFINEDALASIGASYPITMIFMAIATGSNIGCSVIISRLFGGKEHAKMKTAVFTSLISIIVLSFILTIAGLLACNPLLHLLNTPNNIFSDADVYLRIYIGGLIFLLLYNICTGIFTSLGDSRTPLYFLIASSLLNIILDLVFVINFHMGVAGVAWATFIAQGLASALSFITVVLRIKTIHTEAYPKFSFIMLKRISTIAIPSILQQSFISVGNLFIQGIINSYGSSVIAGYSAAMKLNTFAITSFATLGNGVSNFTSQNIGAGKLKRVSKGFNSGVFMSLCVVVPFFITYYGFSSMMMGIFLDSTKSADGIVVGTQFLRIVSPFYAIISIKLIADGVLRGAGDMVSFMIATFADLILRVVLAFILSNYFETTGIWISWPIGWVVAAILSYIFYATGVWKKAVM